MPVHPYDVARILGGERVLGVRVRTLDRLAEHVAGYAAAAAELKYGIVPKATLHRRRTRLSPEESERLERLARVTAMAESVWEDKALAHEFLTSPQPQLGGARPVELVRSDLGSRQVEQLLNGLEYALPA